MQPVKKLRDALGEAPKTVRQLVDETGLSYPQVSGLLLTMYSRSVISDSPWLVREKIDRVANKGRREVWAYRALTNA